MSDEEYAYLRDGFNPKSLRKDQLRNILLTHGVDYAPDALKPQLLELFHQEIVPRRATLRRQFVGVAPSSTNIEESTPPRAPRSPRRGARRPDVGSAPPIDEVPDSEADEVQLSPRARRARSPARLQRRTASGKGAASKQDPTAAAASSLSNLVTPDLSHKTELSPEPTSTSAPLSPRRRRANRKVDIPIDNTDERLPPPSAVKVAAPRSPRRKRAADEDADESFTQNNVFQQPLKRRRTKAPEPERYTHPKEEFIEASVPDGVPPITEVDLGVDVLSEPLDTDLVAALNEEVQTAEQARGNIPPRLLEPSQVVEKEAVEFASDAGVNSGIGEALGESEEPVSEISTSAPGPSRQGSAHAEMQQTPRPRRRGFIPSIMDMSVSRAFAEQLEPYMIATPAPTPREITPATSRTSALQSPVLQSAGTSSRRQSTPLKADETMLPDAEIAAGAVVHDAVEKAGNAISEVGRRIPHPELPNIPRPHLPRFGLPRVHLPGWNFPRVRVPRLRLPRLSSLRRPRIPRVRNRLPRVRVPSVPTPNVPWRKMKAAFWNISEILFMISAVLLSAGTVTLGILIAAWYRDALSQAEYCDVGVISRHIYPAWVTFDTGFDPVSQVQASLRASMDATWPECIPCPENGRCYQGKIVICDPGYRQSPSPLAFGGIWPFPPRCLDDWEVRRKVDVLGERTVSVLRERRAKVICSDSTSGEKERMEMSASELEATLRKEKAPELGDDEFEELWQQVIQGLPQKYSDVEVVRVTSLTAHNNAYEQELTSQTTRTRDDARLSGAASTAAEDVVEAAERIELEAGKVIGRYLTDEVFWYVSTSDVAVPLSCRARLVLMKWLQNHRTQLIKVSVALFAAVLVLSTIMRWRSRRMALKSRVTRIVDELKAQRALADADPAGKTPFYVKTYKFRQEVPRKQWKQVQRAVESVDGVRVRQLEIYGEITRVWEWAA